jgi:hypothetical protein
MSTEPSKQFNLVRSVIARTRSSHVCWSRSPVYIMVEFNLGFEAEHHEKNLNNIPDVQFRMDHQHRRVGIFTTCAIKNSACTLLNEMLREQRVSVYKHLISNDPIGMRAKLKDQLLIYSYQFKQPGSVFGKEQVSLSGKVGGLKDDIAISLQLGIYYTALDLNKTATLGIPGTRHGRNLF